MGEAHTGQSGLTASKVAELQCLWNFALSRHARLTEVRAELAHRMGLHLADGFEAAFVVYPPGAKLTRKPRSLRTVRTYGLRVPSSCVLCCTTGGAGQLAPGKAVLYVRRTRTSLGRAVRTAYRGTAGPPLGVMTTVPCRVSSSGGDNQRQALG